MASNVNELQSPNHILFSDQNWRVESHVSRIVQVWASTNDPDTPYKCLHNISTYPDTPVRVVSVKKKSVTLLLSSGVERKFKFPVLNKTQ